MRVLLVTMAFVTLAGCASGTISTLNDEHYGCSATGNFFDFSGETAIAECRKKIDQFCQLTGAPTVIGKTASEPSGYGRYATADMDFQCISAKDAEVKKRQVAEIKNQQMKAVIQNAKSTCQQDFGFTPNTPEFGNCLLQIQRQSIEHEREQSAQAAGDERSEAALAQQRREASDRNAMGAMQMLNDNNNKAIDRINNRVTPGINCTSYSYGSTVQTNCN